LTPFDFPTFFSHKPPCTSDTQAASTGTSVNAESLSPPPSIEKQGTNDAIFVRRGSANITTVSPYKAELKKNR